MFQRGAILRQPLSFDNYVPRSMTNLSGRFEEDLKHSGPRSFRSEAAARSVNFSGHLLEANIMMTTRIISHFSVAIIFSLVLCVAASAQIFNGSPAEGASSGVTQVHKDPAVQQTAWPSIPLPKISMPKVSMPDMSVITKPVKAGFSKVTSGTKKAWEGTKEIFTFGKGNSTEPAGPNNSQPKQSMWGRMFSSEPEQRDGPQTVGEWMSQPRLDP
jgi:hypothetical protein